MRMHKIRVNKIGVVLLLIMLSGASVVFGQQPNDTPPPPFASPQPNSIPPPPFASQPSSVLSESDLTQFQNWLKSNNQKISSTRAQENAKRIAQSNTQSSDALVISSKPLSYSESQALMLKQAPPSPPPSADAEAAFNGMMQQNMPLTPQQVVRLKQMIDASQRAAAIPATIPPKPVSSTLMINLAPGATPPAIRLAQGYVTSLVFVDSAGSPWPLASYDIGDPKMTTIQWDGKSNVVLVQAASPYGDSDIVIRLVGLATPITLQLVSGQRVVDYRTDIHVAGFGPNSKDLPTGTGLPNSANQLLLNVLDGIAPPGSKQLVVKGGDCMAWLLGNTMYLRTRMTVLSPGWKGRMTSPDGMYAYEIQKSSSVLVSQYGEPIELKIEGF